MYFTRRSQNFCESCGYTWHPRGHDLSRCCPNCNSKDIGIVPPPALPRWIAWLFLISIVSVILFVLVANGDLKLPFALPGIAKTGDSSRSSPAAAALPTPQPVPREITLTSPIQFPITVGGKPSGMVTLPPGTRLKLLSISQQNAVVRYVDATATIPLSSTDYQPPRH